MILPNDIFYEIIKFCDKKDIIKLNLSCRSIYKITCHDFFWECIYNKKYSEYISTNPMNWRTKFINKSKMNILIQNITTEFTKNKIETVYQEKIFSDINKIKWIRKGIINKPKKKFKTIIKNHIYNGYFISDIYILDDDIIYFSNYFVNSSQYFNILYKIYFDKYLYST